MDKTFRNLVSVIYGSRAYIASLATADSSKAGFCFSGFGDRIFFRASSFFDLRITRSSPSVTSGSIGFKTIPSQILSFIVGKLNNSGIVVWNIFENILHSPKVPLINILAWNKLCSSNRSTAIS